MSLLMAAPWHEIVNHATTGLLKAWRAVVLGTAGPPRPPEAASSASMPRWMGSGVSCAGAAGREAAWRAGPVAAPAAEPRGRSWRGPDRCPRRWRTFGRGPPLAGHGRAR